MEQDEQARAAKKLRAIYRVGLDLELELRFREEGEHADQIKARTDELSRVIDAVLADLLSEWATQAGTTTAKLVQAEEKAREANKKVQERVRVAQNVIKAAGALDNAIKIGAKLVGFIV